MRGLIAAGFLAFIAFTSNPFLRLNPTPGEGQDLNPVVGIDFDVWRQICVAPVVDFLGGATQLPRARVV
jgi:cytochrome c biogenesis factor